MSDRLSIIQPGPLSIIGQGIRSRLQEVFPDRQFVHAWVPARVTRDVWTKLTRRTPFIGLGFNGFTPSGESQPMGLSQWSAYLVTRNEGSADARLFGDRQAPGLFGMLEVGIGALHGHLIPDGGTVRVHEATHAYVEDFHDDGVAMGTLELVVPTGISLTDVIAGGDAEPGTITTQAITWAFEDEAQVITGTYQGTP